MRVIGLMSGTSMDGVDAALLETNGEGVQAFGPWTTLPLLEDVRALLRGAMVAAQGMAAPGPMPPAIAAAERAITESHVEAVRGLLRQVGPVDLIGFHGQTILHRPHDRWTWQIGDAQYLADSIGVPVAFDFRTADVAAGGQGAPLAPLYHQALARDLAPPLAVLNLGGVGNVTFLGAGGEVIAFDTGPGNALIDDWTRATTGRAFDADGALAAAGRVDAARLAPVLVHPYFAAAPPKSLDRHDFDTTCVEGLAAADGAATLAALTVEAVAAGLRHLPQAPQRWLVTGGGRHNPVLMAGLRRRLGMPVEPVEAVGWRGDALEAEAFAFLAVRTLRGLPLSLPTTTGVVRAWGGGRVVQPRPTTGQARG
ncbi:anhydro-N-acetylmuramic acid kinase [Zavarzinia sp. CC-PAN008]|uniref:anhydro-N-acetylmuramic acid kinase n=1 Tax=Zavarzinia sp. CC-PAN008 TaxID=3243332 RepID=UPI003F74912E